MVLVFAVICLILLLLVSVYSFFTVFFLNLVSVNQLEWSVVGAVLTYPGLFLSFFKRGQH